MKLRTKIILLSGVPLLGLCVAITGSFFVTKTIDRSIAHTVGQSERQTELCRDLQLGVVQVQQFLTDISATRGLDGLDDGFSEAEKQRADFVADVNELKVLSKDQDASETAQLEKIGKDFEAYYSIGRRMAEAYVKDGPAAGNKMMPEFDKGAEALDAALQPFVEKHTAAFRAELDGVRNMAHNTNLTIAIFGLILVAGSIVFAHFTGTSIWGPLTGRIDSIRQVEVHLREAAGMFKNSSQAVAEAASSQAASLEETSASLEEISSMTKRNAENATNSKNLSREANESANAGLEKLGEMGRTLGSIKVAVSDMEQAVKEMQGSSQEIAKIIKTIDEIAFQTNLLALNAAVEAARAGEAGAGFAVVADEVRALAQRSAQAARDTSEKIEAAIKRSELGGVASAKVVKNLAEVEQTAGTIETVISGIVTQVKSLDAVINEIAAASQEQSSGVAEVNMAVGQMDKVTQGNAASAEENASAAHSLQTQVVTLQGIVGGLQSILDGQTRSDAAILPTDDSSDFASPGRMPAPLAKRASASSPVSV